MNNKIKGVNLGGWLVLEKWMAPSLFNNTNADDEYYLAHDLPKEAYESRINTHRSQFINESDFLRIANSGFTHVRIPVPYFIFGDRAPFIGCIDELDKAFNWAEHYGLTILIDLHTAPYSQNGFDNGGLSGVCKWAQMPEEVDFIYTVLTRLAERYKDREGLWGIQILNEPATEGMWESMNPLKRFPARDKEMAEGSAPINLEFLYGFYQEAYGQLREILPDDKVIVFHDGFELHAWEEFFKNNDFVNVRLDTHQYIMTAEAAGTEQNVESYIKYLDNLGKELEKVVKYVDVFVGEWSLFNSYTVGADTKGGINPTQQEFESTKRFTKEELKEIYRTLWDKSVETWNIGDGYFYWTYKLNIDTVNDPAWYGWDAWDMNRGLSNEWVDINSN